MPTRIRLFFSPWLQSGSRTARPAGAQSHAFCRCGVGCLTESCCWRNRGKLAVGSGFAIEQSWPSRISRQSGWMAEELWLRFKLLVPSLRPRLRRSSGAAAWRHLHDNGNRAQPENLACLCWLVSWKLKNEDNTPFVVSVACLWEITLHRINYRDWVLKIESNVKGRHQG